MPKHLFVVISLLLTASSYTQNPQTQDSTKTAKAAAKAEFIKQIANGYLPIKYFNLDLRYLIKFNQYEGFRTGLGGTTNTKFSEKYRFNGYLVYGFVDKRYKYGFGGGFRVNKATNTWLNLNYTDDLQETGSSTFLTDKRFFTFFEPRLLNIDLFHRHITKSVSLQHQFSKQLLTETQFAVSKINPTYNYTFSPNQNTYQDFDLSIAKLSLQWNPFDGYQQKNESEVIKKEGFPQFTLQYTQSFKSVFGSDFTFSKLDFRSIYEFQHKNSAVSNMTLVAGLANGNVPLTHLYHAYPNNINKETVLQRFSVAGLTSFETMYFNEFFSDRFTTLQLKHYFPAFKISERFKPQLVLISRYALGNMSNINRHQGITFGTLNKLYSESGLEINKLLFGFGLSFAYRYGAYHLPEWSDNFAFKFTFNVSL